MNPAIWLARTAARWPGRPALFHGVNMVCDYSGFADTAARLGNALGAQRLGPGTRIAVLMKNGPSYLEALYAIWWAGAAAVPINAKLHPREAAWIIGHADVALIIADEAHAAALHPVLGPARLMLVPGSPDWHEMLTNPPLAAPVHMAKDDLAWLFYTSGTTGRPKGVQITCGNLMAMTLCYFTDVDEVHPEDAALYAAPMSHGAGLYNFMHMIRGARHMVPESGGFDATEVLTLARDLGPVSMFAAPTMVRRLVAEARARGETGEGLRTLVYAGGPMYEADILETVRVMGPRFVQIYGQGECPMGITALPRSDVADRSHPDWRARLNSVGRAQSAVEVAIGDGGEILVRGATVMAGYWRDPEATAQTLRSGWLHTGDVGRLDDAGYLTLLDRAKDMIISGGSNIYPREVEEVLLSHPGVSEVAVLGRPHADWGEEVVAFVVAKGDVATEALDAHCLDRIARFKRPKAYLFVADLPKNNYGKVLKADLRARLSETGA